MISSVFGMYVKGGTTIVQAAVISVDSLVHVRSHAQQSNHGCSTGYHHGMSSQFISLISSLCLYVASFLFNSLTNGGCKTYNVFQVKLG